MQILSPKYANTIPFLFQLFIKTSKSKVTALEKNMRGKVNIFLLDEIYLK